MPITAPEHLNFELHSLSRTVGYATTTGHSTYFWSFHSTHSMGTLYLRGHSPWTGDTAPVVPAPWTSCFIFWVPVSSSGKMREDWRVEPHMLKLQPLWLTWAFRKCTALPQLHLERKSPSLDAGPSWLRLWPGHLALTQDANSTSSRGDYHRQREQTQVKLSCFKIQPQDQFGPKLIDLWRIISCQCRVGMIKPEMGASSGPGHHFLRSEHLCGLEGTVLLMKQIRLFRSRKENGDHYSHVKPLFGSTKAWSKMNDPPRFEGCGEEERESSLLVGTELQVGKMEKVLRMVSSDGCTVEMCFMPRNCALKNGEYDAYLPQ